jgi:hypothetical protein
MYDFTSNNFHEKNYFDVIFLDKSNDNKNNKKKDEFIRAIFFILIKVIYIFS